MGFSVSGATAVVFVGLLVSAGTLYPVVDRFAERRSDAVAARDERALTRQNTAVAVDNATYDPGAGELTVAVTNTGASALAVPAVDLLVDGAYATPSSTTVAGDAGTEVWLPGETLTVRATTADSPNRVKVVTGPGVAATAAVEVS
jgi:flagellar protein FlaF